MDVDRPSLVSYCMNEEDNNNAEAGPSSQPAIPAVFLAPQGPPSRLPLFDSTQDLITRFQLLPAYDKYVRPHIRSFSDGQSMSTPGAAPTPGPHQALTPGGLDKGKGKEVPVTPSAALTPGGGDGGDGDGDDEDGKGDKKKKNSYKHLIKGIPGKHSMKKDDYLQMMMQVPPKQTLSIAKFDLRTQRDAFSVSLEGLKGWNMNALVAESAQAREDRKKRKELKKLAKIQAVVGTSSGSQPASAISPTSALPIGAFAASGSTPIVGSSARRGQTPSSVGTPRPALAPPQRSGSRPPGSGPGPLVDARARTPALNTPTLTTTTPRPAPPSAGNLTLMDPFAIKRGRKREHEEEVSGVDTASVNGNTASAGVQKWPTGSGSARAGVEGVRPRPMKKPRTDSNGHGTMGLPVMAREVPQQQPTPQGV